LWGEERVKILLLARGYQEESDGNSGPLYGISGDIEPCPSGIGIGNSQLTCNWEAVCGVPQIHVHCLPWLACAHFPIAVPTTPSAATCNSLAIFH
jgi:hypothetical protein